MKKLNIVINGVKISGASKLVNYSYVYNYSNVIIDEISVSMELSDNEILEAVKKAACYNVDKNTSLVGQKLEIDY